MLLTMTTLHKDTALKKTEDTQWHFVQRFGLLIVGCACIAFLAVYQMDDDPRYSLCFLRRVLGVPCPTCGLTRAFNDFAHFDLHAAIAHHPLSPFVLLLVLGGWLWAVWHHIHSLRAPLPTGKKFTYIIIAIAAVFFITWVFRVLIPLLHS